MQVSWIIFKFKISKENQNKSYLHLMRLLNKIMIHIDNKRMTQNLFKNQREKPNKKEKLKLPEVHQA